MGCSPINWWGKRRWLSRGLVKQVQNIASVCIVLVKALYGRVYRWLVLSLIAYILAHWAYLSIATTNLPDWGQAAQIAFQTFFPQLLLCCFLLDLERMVRLHLVVELTLKFAGARYKFNETT
jgi:hypothetical protein